MKFAIFKTIGMGQDINEDNSPGAEDLAQIRICGTATEEGEPIARMGFETIG